MDLRFRQKNGEVSAVKRKAWEFTQLEIFFVDVIKGGNFRKSRFGIDLEIRKIDLTVKATFVKM